MISTLYNVCSWIMELSVPQVDGIQFQLLVKAPRNHSVRVGCSLHSTGSLTTLGSLMRGTLGNHRQ